MWAKLDDGMFDHRKILAAGPLATHLHIAAIVWSARNLTDGFIPLAKVATLVNWTGVLEHMELASDAGQDFFTGSAVVPERLVDTLLGEALWTEVPGGYLIHDFLVYNRSKAQVLAERAAHADRQARHQQRRRDTKTDAVTDAVTDGRADGVTDTAPVPVPVLVEQKKLAIARKEKTLRKAKTPWPETFVLTPALAAYATRQGLDARYQWGKFQAHAQRDDVRHVNWVRAWEYWVRNAWEFDRRHA